MEDISGCFTFVKVAKKQFPVLWKPLSSVLIGLFSVCLLLEAVFRILPVSDRVEIMPVDAAHPYLHFRPSTGYRLTQGNLFQIRAYKRTNNEGFFSDLDIVEGDTAPRVAVIGDSFVEAIQVANGDAVHARLDSLLPVKWKVYGIGSSGSALPQYLAYARYARERLNPRAFVFVIYQNDFFESVAGKSPVAGHHYFTPNGRVVRYDRPAESIWRRVIFSSAFFRYLWLNVKLPRFFRGGQSKQNHIQSSNDILTTNLLRVFVNNLVEVSGGVPVWVITDAPRPAIYGNRWEEEQHIHPVYRLYRNFRDECERVGFRTVDMAPVFRRDYLQHYQRFEFPTDGHWNQRGHLLAAEALAQSMQSSLFPEKQ
jgi:hypothetical protein